MSYNKKKDDTYIGFVKGYKIDYPNLVSEGRKQIKIYKINPTENINEADLRNIVQLLKDLY